MDMMIKSGMIVLSLAVLWAMFALLMAIFKYVKRIGILKLGTSNKEIFERSFKANFVDNALHDGKQLSAKSTLVRAIISILLMIAIVIVVFLTTGSEHLIMS